MSKQILHHNPNCSDPTRPIGEGMCCCDRFRSDVVLREPESWSGGEVITGRTADGMSAPTASIRLIPIYSATAIPVKAELAELSVVGKPFTLTIDAGRAADMAPVTQDAVQYLNGCAIQCKVIEFKENKVRGMVVSIDKIHRGETVVPFHCNREMVSDLVGISRPYRKYEFHPERHSWGVLVREEKNQDNLVLILGAMILLAGAP